MCEFSPPIIVKRSQQGRGIRRPVDGSRDYSGTTKEIFDLLSVQLPLLWNLLVQPHVWKF